MQNNKKNCPAFVVRVGEEQKLKKKKKRKETEPSAPRWQEYLASQHPVSSAKDPGGTLRIRQPPGPLGLSNLWLINHPTCQRVQSVPRPNQLLKEVSSVSPCHPVKTCHPKHQEVPFLKTPHPSLLKCYTIKMTNVCWVFLMCQGLGRARGK